MALQDIPVFREARRGQVLRSDDWNGVQREVRQGIRAHRHTRLASAPANDSANTDLARQISTDEIADGAVTAAKLAPGVLTPPGDDGSPSALVAAKQATGSVSVPPRGTLTISHGLGSVPIGVVLGIQQAVSGLRGDFEVYGATSVTAAVPRTPDGGFTLVSASDSQVTVRWWAFTGADTSSLTAVEAPPTPRRRTRRGT